MDIVLVPLIETLLGILNLYKWALIVYAIMSWLFVFNVFNPTNMMIQTISRFLYRIIDPVLKHLRRIIPSLGGIDLSLIALFLLVHMAQLMLMRILIRFI